MRIREALLRMIASRLIALVVMAASFAVLGRLLSPEAFGHFAVALAIFGLALTVSEFGLRQYLIRAPEIDDAMLGSATGVALALSLGMCALCLLGAVLLEGILPRPVAAALVPMSLALVIGPFLLSTEALLQRDLDFTLIAVSNVVRVVADGAVAVALALAGFGALALGSGLLASHLAGAAVLLAWGGRARRFRPRLGGWRRFGGWGGRLVTIQALPSIADLAVVSAVSGIAGAGAMGLLNRAQTINKMFDRVLLEGVTPVVLPALSSALNAGARPIAVYFAKVDYMAVVCWPGFALIALLAEPLVLVLLGPGWDAAVLPLRLLALAGVAMPVSKMSLKFFTTIDRLPLYLRIQTSQQLLRVALVAAAAFLSIEAVAAALTASVMFKAAALILTVKRLGRASGRYREIGRRAALVTAASLVGPAALLLLGLPAVAELALALPLAVLGWLGAVALLRHRVFGDIRETLRSLHGRFAMTPNRP